MVCYRRCKYFSNTILLLLKVSLNNGLLLWNLQVFFGLKGIIASMSPAYYLILMKKSFTIHLTRLRNNISHNFERTYLSCFTWVETSYPLCTPISCISLSFPSHYISRIYAKCLSTCVVLTLWWYYKSEIQLHKNLISGRLIALGLFNTLIKTINQTV